EAVAAADAVASASAACGPSAPHAPLLFGWGVGELVALLLDGAGEAGGGGVEPVVAAGGEPQFGVFLAGNAPGVVLGCFPEGDDGGGFCLADEVAGDGDVVL